MKKEFKSENGEKLKSVIVNYEDGIITAEYEPVRKFKRGDIIADKCGLRVRVYIFDRYCGKDRCFAFCELALYGTLDTKCLTSMEICDDFTLATESEKQLLFDALRREGKRWNDKTLEVEDIILVPENIGIYRNDAGKLVIRFNNENQVLSFFNEIYIVLPFNSTCYERVQCELIPCKRENLEAGDTALRAGRLNCEKNNSESFLCNYRKILSNKTSVFISEDQSVIVSELPSPVWYKLVPIK